MVFRNGDAAMNFEEYARENGLKKFEYADVYLCGSDDRSEAEFEQVITDFFKDGIPDWMGYTGKYDAKTKRCLGDKIDKLCAAKVIEFIKKASKLSDGIVVVDMYTSNVSMDLNTAKELGIELKSWCYQVVNVKPKCLSTLDSYGNIIEPGDLVVTKTCPVPTKVQFVTKNKVYTAIGGSVADKSVLIKSAKGNPISYGPFVS